MEYKEALNKVVEALKGGQLSMEEIEQSLKGDIEIPVDMTSRFHMLFCTKHRSGGDCHFYEEMNRTTHPTIDTWADVIRLYMKEFSVTIDDVRAEIDYLFTTLRGSLKLSSRRLTTMYFVYFLLDDEKLSKFMERFVQKLNTADSTY